MAVMNNPAHCVTIFLVLMFTAEAHVIFNETFQDSSYQSDFTLDYSWDQHPHASPKYFDIAGAPQGSGNALRISIHADDKPFIKGNPTCPRTELAGNHEGYFLHDGTAYVAQWDVYFAGSYPEDYWFCWAQVFGDGHSNVMLRWEKGAYAIWANNKKTTLPGNIQDDLGRWNTWRLEFLLDSSNGYVRVYKNNNLLGGPKGATSGGAHSNWKMGIYTQHEPCQVKDFQIYVRDFTLTGGS